MFATGLPWPLGGTAPAAPVARPVVGVAPVATTNFMGTNLYYPSWLPTTDLYGSIVSGIFYVSLAIFVIFLILVFIHFVMFPVFSFSPNDPGYISVPTVSDRQLAFTQQPAASDLSANFVNVPACQYTISSDVYLSGNFQTASVPRVILYRSPTSISPAPTDTSGNLIGDFPNTNLIVWVDPMMNDLYVSAVTAGAITVPVGSPAAHMLQTTRAIKNIPIKKVFRLTVVFTPKFLEVYINGSLEQSLVLTKVPIAVPDSVAFFPAISTINHNIMVANVAFWPRAITPNEVRTDGNPISKEVFFGKTVS